MVDYRARTLEVVVAEDVVDVMLGVDDIADRAVRLGLRAHRNGLRRQLRRIDHDNPVAGDDVARVAAAQLRLSANVAGYLFHRLTPLPATEWQ